MKPTIFVQIASYRDPDLIPTLIDLIDQAACPEHLRIVVCWQHSLDEVVAHFVARGFYGWTVGQRLDDTVHRLAYKGAHIELIDVPHFASQGACWARNKIQQHYRGERYTLQLDSHHRFVRHWDRCIIEMLESLRPASPKPLLTAYLPGFDPSQNDPAGRKTTPTIMVFNRIAPDGPPLFLPADLTDWEARQAPVPARFYSAHFAFADGCFAEEVPHDPAYFFLGEEISIGVRAFTHGYDLYHPHRLIAWHEYSRTGRVKIWDEHTAQAKTAGVVSADWTDRDRVSFRRNRILFGIDGEDPTQIDFGKYGFGTERSLDTFERYAGIRFRDRAVHQAVIDRQPPILGAGPEPQDIWERSLKRANTVRITVHQSELGDVASIERWDITFDDGRGQTVHRHASDGAALRQHLKADWLDFQLPFYSELGHIPKRYVLQLRGDDLGQTIAIERHIDAP